MNATDILVETTNPAVLDRTVSALGAHVIEIDGHYLKEDGCYRVRTFGDPGFIEFAISTQGYGTVRGRKQVSDA